MRSNCCAGFFFFFLSFLLCYCCCWLLIITYFQHHKLCVLVLWKYPLRDSTLVLHFLQTVVLSFENDEYRWRRACPRLVLKIISFRTKLSIIISCSSPRQKTKKTKKKKHKTTQTNKQKKMAGSVAFVYKHFQHGKSVTKLLFKHVKGTRYWEH